ncbi:MAG: TAXI family TRAP transporter solute-binding subunit [Chromatiales bacterium]|jgi:TRAP transporter TAXI family solute receptor
MRTWLATVVLPVVVTIAAFSLAYQFVDPAPPKFMAFTTGETDGAYEKYALRYQTLLAKNGIELQILPSQGSLENINRLQLGEADAGFVQGGTAGTDPDPGLRSLGSLYYEPLWLFYRASDTISVLGDLQGKRLAVGHEGSGTRALVMRLLEQNRIRQDVQLVDLDTSLLSQSLADNEIDAVFLVGSPTSVHILKLLTDARFELYSFKRAEAYQRRLNFLSHVVLPRGMVDMARDIPAQDKLLLAPTANLVVRKDLHPALQDLLLQAAESIHGDGGWFEQHGEFPNAQNVEFPISPEARRFYKYGAPFLQRYLPFWAASLIDRLKVMLLPLIVLMIPLLKIMPPIYTWRMRSKIYRWYQELEQIDLLGDKTDSDRGDLLEKLRLIEQDVIHVRVPLSFAGQLYDLRQHIELVKRRLG